MTPNEYTDVIIPAIGLKNIFLVTLSKNSSGNINPGENGIVYIVVTNTPLIGQYESKTIFNIKFNMNSWIIVNSSADNYINDIGYENVELKNKGTIIN